MNKVNSYDKFHETQQKNRRDFWHFGIRLPADQALTISEDFPTSLLSVVLRVMRRRFSNAHKEHF